MTPHYVTYFDTSYASRGMAMLDSLLRWQPDACVTVLCLDDPVWEIVSEEFDSRITAWRNDYLTKRSWQLRRLRRTRGKYEFYATQKPALIVKAMEEFVDPGEWIAIIDADTWFYNDPEPAYHLLSDASIAISPHRFNLESENLVQYGVFNAGFGLWRNDEFGRTCLSDWAKACRQWCFSKVRGSKFMNQGYLTSWPNRYGRLSILEHPGLNLAPWNVGTHNIQASRDGILVNGEPLIFFHFSRAFRYRDGGWWTDYAFEAMNNRVVLNGIYKNYLEAVDRAANHLESRFDLPGLTFAELPNDGRPILNLCASNQQS